MSDRLEGCTAAAAKTGIVYFGIGSEKAANDCMAKLEEATGNVDRYELVTVRENISDGLPVRVINTYFTVREKIKPVVVK